MNELRELVSDFKDKTQLIIICLENDSVSELENLLDDRQSTIDKINALSFSSSKFNMFCDEHDIPSLQIKCNELIENKMSQTREELKKISVNKSMNKQYNQSSYVDSIYFNKKF